MKNLEKKLRSRTGETLAETLIAMLIAVIALTMLANMISSTLRMVNNSKEKMKDYYESAEKLEIMNPDEPDKSFNVNLTASNLLVPISVLCYENITFNDTDKAVYAYIKNPNPTNPGP